MVSIFATLANPAVQLEQNAAQTGAATMAMTAYQEDAVPPDKPALVQLTNAIPTRISICAPTTHAVVVSSSIIMTLWVVVTLGYSQLLIL